MELTLKEYISSLRSLYGIAGGIGALVPAAALFIDLAPPLLPSSGAFACAFAAVALIGVYYYQPDRQISEGRFPPMVVKAFWLIGWAAVLLVIYVGLLSFLTVFEGGQRFQIGFYKMDWSLTSEGLGVKAAHPHETPKQWMRSDGLFTDDGPEIIWAQWSRVAAFALMFVVFSTAFVLWSAAWGLLARERGAKVR